MDGAFESYRKLDSQLMSIRFQGSSATGTSRVSASALRAVLSRIHMHSFGTASCCVSIERLANETGLSVRTISRAIAALQDLGIVDVAEKQLGASGFFANHYAIDWSVVFHS